MLWVGEAARYDVLTFLILRYKHAGLVQPQETPCAPEYWTTPCTPLNGTSTAFCTKSLLRCDAAKPKRSPNLEGGSERIVSFGHRPRGGWVIHERSFPASEPEDRLGGRRVVAALAELDGEPAAQRKLDAAMRYLLWFIPKSYGLMALPRG